MNPLTKKLMHLSKGMLNLELVHKEVTKQWQKKAKCLENLTNENKDQLKKLDLQLLKGLEYEGNPAETMWILIKESENITPSQNKFAKFLYTTYPEHSIKTMGFE